MARLIVPRTVTVVDGERSRSAPLEEFRSARAYILLGDPGAGKTEAFRVACEGHDDGEFITARRFIRKGTDRLSDWVGKTLFIDGLDEVRAGSSDPRRPLDQVLERLGRLGRPTFRLSCRAADWLGPNDLREIVSEAGYDDLRVLHLEPLTGTDIPRILADLGVSDVAGFLAEARGRGLRGLLDNPQLLGLLVKATRDGQWPEDRRGTLALACQELAREWNDEHRAAHRNAPPMSSARIVLAAGHLSALSLLSGRNLVSLDSSDDSEYLHSEDIFDGDQPALMRAVKSNLFESRFGGGFATPHRQLAEFLAAGFLQHRIEAGVPFRRVMALMTGDDGIVVTELRGLAAWLAAFDRASRLALVESDPVGVALYGDVSSFRSDEMEHLLHAFAERAGGVWPRGWPTVALTLMINEHAVAVLARYLNEDDRTEGRQGTVDLLLFALSRAAGARPCLKSLERAIKDATWNPVVRKSALQALLYHSGDEASSTLIRLVDDLRDGRVEDRDGDLMGTLLNHLYPVHLGPGQIGDFEAPESARTDEYLAVTKWLAERPELQKELALKGLNRRVGDAESAPGSHHQGADHQDDHGHARASAVYRATQINNEYRKARQRKKKEFITYVRKHAVELQEGRCPPGLLHRIAVAYHDFSLDQRAATPQQRVLTLLQGDQDLAVAAMRGFRRVVDREDLPTLREVIRLNEQKQMSQYALPILAALDANPGLLESRSPAETGRAAALYYLTPVNVPGHPAWYRWALEHRPEPISEALLKVTRSRVRRRLDCNYLWDLGRNGSYRYVAQLAAVPLLRAFPTRCTEPQISALHLVLLAALRWQVDGLGAFVEGRAAKPDLDVSQRALWLTAGLLLSPERYADRIAAFLEDGEEARSRQVVRLLAPDEMVRLPMQWDTRVLAEMIKLMGGRYSPWRPEGSGMASVVDEDRWKVKGLIAAWATTLASRTSRHASEALHSLADDPTVEPWHYMLKCKRDEQIVARRDATFAVPDLRAVQQTLANGEPGNPADLAALVADRLERLGREIRHGSTNDWRQYWNEDDFGRPTRPKREESCCKALLAALQKELPGGVDAHRESVHSRDKRSDIRVFFNGHAIPVEVKKDSNRRLWSAVADQLIAKYTTAPEFSGFGIYLVLWFGQGKTPVPPTGRRPKTPEELCVRLEEHLADPHRHKIRVIVIDVSTTGSRPKR